MSELIFLSMAMAVVATTAPSLTAEPATPPAAPHSSAQLDAPAAATPPETQVRCADYRQLKTGAWTPRKPVVVGGVSLSPGAAFTPGVAFSGIDLAAVLNAHCKAVEK